jgi:ATP-dependent DNA ligase
MRDHRLICRRACGTSGHAAALPSSAAAKLRANSFTMDGEAVVVGADGVAMFDALHRRHRATDAGQQKC